MDSEVSIKELARDVYYALCDDGILADLAPKGSNAARESILRVLMERLARPSAAGDAVDIYEGHAENCHAVHPGDRECNCHKAYGFDTAEDMEIADHLAAAPAGCKELEWALRTREAYHFTENFKNRHEYRDAAVAFIEAHATAASKASEAGDETEADNAKAADRACLAMIAQGYYWNGEAWARNPPPVKVSDHAGPAHCEGHTQFEYDCIDCADKAIRTPQAVPAPAVAGSGPDGRSIQQLRNDGNDKEADWLCDYNAILIRHARIVAEKDAEIERLERLSSAISRDCNDCANDRNAAEQRAAALAGLLAGVLRQDALDHRHGLVPTMYMRVRQDAAAAIGMTPAGILTGQATPEGDEACNCASGRGAEHCIVHAAPEARS